MVSDRNIVRGLRIVAFALAALGAVLVILSLDEIGDGGIVLRGMGRPPTMATALSVLFGGAVLLGCAREGAPAGLRAAREELRRRMPGRGRLALFAPLVASVLLLPLGLGFAGAELLESAREWRERPEPAAPWLTMANRAGPPALVERCLREIAPGEKVLLAGSRPRDLRGFLLAYYLYPRPLYMLPADRMEMFYEHRRAQFDSDDPGMVPFPAWTTPTPAEYRAFIEERGIDWVIVNVTDSSEDAQLVRAEEAFR